MNSDRTRIAVSVISSMIIILGLMIITAVIVADSNEPPATSQPRTVYPADAGSMREQAFLAALDVSDIQHSEPVALTIARRVCRYLDQGGTMFTATSIPAEYGYGPYDSGYIVGAASQSICKGAR